MCAHDSFSPACIWQSDEGLLSKEEERRRAFLKRELERQALAERKVNQVA